MTSAPTKPNQAVHQEKSMELIIFKQNRIQNTEQDGTYKGKVVPVLLLSTKP
jgi:hypothetical protein